METVTKVDLDLDTIRKVVEAEGGCLAWGGALRLGPAEDILIGVERQLDIDPERQLIASVLSKKIAAGAKRLVLDIPVGLTAKVKSLAAGHALAKRMTGIAARFGVAAHCLLSDGRQPVGRSVGLVLEMMDVLAVLRGESAAPADLARLQRIVTASESGTVQAVDNRKITRLAKFAGAPESPSAGLRLHARLGDSVNRGDLLFTLHAETAAELNYALDYPSTAGDVIKFSKEAPEQSSRSCRGSAR